MDYVSKLFFGIIAAIMLLCGFVVYTRTVGTSTKLSIDEIDQACQKAGGVQLYGRDWPTVCIRSSAIIEIDRNRKQ